MYMPYREKPIYLSKGINTWLAWSLTFMPIEDTYKPMGHVIWDVEGMLLLFLDTSSNSMCQWH